MYQDWASLEAACKNCRKCGLCQDRHHVVFGVGNPQAKIMFVGEGPGENEDLQGEPFVGRGGQLLDKSSNAVPRKTATPCPRSRRPALTGCAISLFCCGQKFWYAWAGWRPCG